MLAIQLACAAIVALFAVVRVRRGPDPWQVARRLALLAAASWIGEETCIRLYGFYFYAGGWSFPIDRVPLLVPLIWPVVILSAHDLAQHVLGAPRRPAAVALLGAAIVLADASLIEPIAVQAGLWTWTAPGLFGVPPIGVLGWAFFAGAAILVMERASPPAEAAVLLVAPAATHALLLAAWWGALRWLSGPIAPWPVVAVAWGLSLVLAGRAWRTGLRRRVPRVFMWLRVPAAAFFFVLLAERGRAVAPLVVYALAFAPPYVAMTAFR
jgi:hypothetical protein